MTRTPTVLDGELQRTSPSALKKWHDCQRLWAFRYVAKILEPTSEAAQAGKDGHARIERYLKTGENVLTEIEAPAKVWIPQPLTVTVEAKIEAGAGAVEVANIPIIGVVDVVNFSGVYVDPEGAAHRDETLEVIDWKYSGSRDPAQWALTPSGLKEALPMSVYGLWAGERIGGLQDHEPVRLSHVTISRRRRDAFKRTALSTVGQCRERVFREEPSIAAMKVAAGVQDPNELPPNFQSCGNYGGCPYQQHCRKTTTESLQSLFQNTRLAAPKESQLSDQSMESRLATLMAAEGPPAPPPVPATPNVDALLTRIRDTGYGSPMIVGEAMAAVYALRGWGDPTGHGIAGAGQIANVRISTVAELAELADEIDRHKAGATYVAPPAAEEPPIQPPHVQEPTPAQVATPIPAEEAITLPGPVREAADAHRVAAEAEAPPVTETAPAPKKKQRGRPAAPDAHWKAMKKPELVAECVRLTAELESRGKDGAGGLSDLTAAYADSEARNSQLETEVRRLENELNLVCNNLTHELTAPSRETKPLLRVWVDCLPARDQLPDTLDGYLDECLRKLAEAGKTAHVLAAADGPCAYGKWKGLLIAMVRSEPPPPGDYTLLGTSGSELRAVLAEALRGCADEFHAGVIR